MKLGIIGGGGLLGATTAFCCAMNSLVDEIVLYDVRGNMAKSHSVDIALAAAEQSDTVVRSGSMDNLKNSDIILNAAGIPDKTGSRDDYLRGNVGIIRDFAQWVRKWDFQPVVICATNPVDVLNYKTFEFSGISREKCIGLSRNDHTRFKWAISDETGMSPRTFDACVLGEHGQYQVPLFSSVKSCETGQRISFTDRQKESILRKVDAWLGEYQGLDAGRTTGWVSGVNISYMIELIVSGKDEVCSCSVITDGEYGLYGLSLALPVKLGPEGVREIVRIDITEEEQAGLTRAAEKIGGLIATTADKPQ